MTANATFAAAARPAKLTDGWLTACSLSLLFAVGCYLRIWGDTGSAAYHSLSALLPDSLWSSAMGRNLFRFALAQIGIHLLLAGTSIALGMLAHRAWRLESCTQRAWIAACNIALMFWVLLANATWFPATSLGTPYADFAALRWLHLAPLDVVTLALACALLATLLRAFRTAPRLHLPARRIALPATVAALLTSIVAVPWPAASGTATTQPNVIVIGIDSLRFDAVDPSHTPALHAFLNSATTFSDATTPLARTFPAWVTLLSGRHPHTTGATTNLLPRDLIRTGETLPELLRQSGYATLYAIDEVRFSNLDTSYGFDRMIAPPIGASDFVLGFFGDTPLANLVVNTAAGRVLFPYAHANRAVSATYDPDTFVRELYT